MSDAIAVKARLRAALLDALHALDELDADAVSFVEAKRLVEEREARAEGRCACGRRPKLVKGRRFCVACQKEVP